MLTLKKIKLVMYPTLTQLSKVVSVFALVLIATAYHVYTADALFLSLKSISIGSSIVNEVTTHTIRFRTSSTSSIGSVVFEYCVNDPFVNTPCTAPPGLTVSGAGIATQTGITGLTKDIANTTVNRIVLTKSASVVNNNVDVTIGLSNITNQSTAQTAYVRISTYATNNGTGVPVDQGGVVYATADGVGIGGYVPPYLTFCVGVTVALDCSSSTGSLAGFGEFSTRSASTLTTQFSGASNDLFGYSTYISGGTMTAGNEIIPPLATNAASLTNVSQFGINLVANSSPSAGSNVSGSGVATPASGYGTQNSFRYNSGELIARSTAPTEYNRFTVTYLVNINEDQRAGIYASSYTFIAVASF